MIVKRMTAILLALLLTAGAALAETVQEDAGTLMYIIRCEEWVSLREEPDKGSERLAELPLGTVVTAYETTGEWTRCSYEEKTGYVLSEYLGGTTETTAEKKTIDGSIRMRVVNVEDSVGLRVQPLKSGDIIAKIPLDTVLDVAVCSPDYGQTTYAGLYGYVLLKYLEPVGN